MSNTWSFLWHAREKPGRITEVYGPSDTKGLTPYRHTRLLRNSPSEAKHRSFRRDAEEPNVKLKPFRLAHFAEEVFVLPPGPRLMHELLHNASHLGHVLPSQTKFDPNQFTPVPARRVTNHWYPTEHAATP